MKRSESSKARLFTQVLPEMAAAAPYFALAAVKRRLTEKGITVSEATLCSYMSEAVAKGVVHDAGRGWYSRLAEPLILDTKPIKGIISRIGKAFPLLDFSCWSTEQINPYMEHLLGKFVTFVDADRDIMPALFEELQGWRDFRVYLNPSAADAAKLRLDDKMIIIRPAPGQAPEQQEHATPIEKLVVDLTVEVEALQLMSRGDFQDLARRLATSGRVGMGALLRYAQRRRLGPEAIFGSGDQATSQIVAL